MVEVRSVVLLLQFTVLKRVFHHFDHLVVHAFLISDRILRVVQAACWENDLFEVKELLIAVFARLVHNELVVVVVQQVKYLSNNV